MLLVEQCYRASRSFPGEERLGLTQQLRRAAVSIPSNVAEGACRKSARAFVNHVSIALGSHAEVETCIEIAFRLGYVDSSTRASLFLVSDKAGRLLNGLRRGLRAASPAAAASLSPPPGNH
jgi:four helix bundle protein